MYPALRHIRDMGLLIRMIRGRPLLVRDWGFRSFFPFFITTTGHVILPNETPAGVISEHEIPDAALSSRERCYF